MKKRLSAFLAVFALFAALAVPALASSTGHVVIADRASGTISVIDEATLAVETIALPDDGEPMYIVVNRAGDRVFVGDRANSQVVVYDPDTWAVEATIPTGEGVFHMWADARDHQLWVNNDVDNTATVIDVDTLEVLATVPMPADLVDAGYKPHDVVLNATGQLAFVTMVGDLDHDVLVQFSTRSFHEINRAPVGLDPHVSIRGDGLLYVPAQNSNVVHVFDPISLTEITRLDIPGAHGAAMSPNGNVFYTTNLPGLGVDGLFAIDTATNTVLGSVDTPFAVPHNVVVTPAGHVFVTHSGGTSDAVSVYTVSRQDPVPAHVADVTVGLNPFGLAFLP